ncbi:hypothetical protein CDD82_1946 [Ophiocordyceps australis]|uniref:Uncharacterized protein n=1 Tax=Ophiocordyceps australis TaxID=1399860 RepID=A0A2C5Y5V0_9HYPO|nr:hypothetical protein CDD82_1946 [Ophiocordyceps australis]
MGGKDKDESCCYMTYRPLSNLPTPPPWYRDASAAAACRSPAAAAALDDGEPFKPQLRGAAIHLVNLIPSAASLAAASVPLVQAMLSRADVCLETVALAVCILDSLDAKFARAWRLECPSSPCPPQPTTRHTPPPSASLSHSHWQARHRQMLHIDSVKPELIILAALVIAVKFTEDPQHRSDYYCAHWGKRLWAPDQLNATERCIMESLDWRIMPLCDQDCLADAMVDMQLAGRQDDWHATARELSPPDSVLSPDDGAAAQVVGALG